MKRFIQIFGAFFCVLLGLSFLGGIAPLFDSLAIFRPVWWVLAGIGTLTFVQPWQFAARIGLIISAFPFLIMFDNSQEFKDRAFRIYQHNLLYTNTAPDLQMLVDRLHPDALTLQEIKASMETVENLKGYPYASICSFAAVGDVGVVSRTPLVDKGCSTGRYRGFAWARIAGEDGQEVTVVSMHLHWPWPYSQRAQLDELIDELEALPQPIVLAGDLNQVLWSQTRRDLEKATGAKALHGLRFTLVRFPIILPIDHVFGNGEHHIERLDRYGSDHNALLADFMNWPAERS